MLGYTFLILSLSIDLWNDRLLGSPAVINNLNQARSLNIHSFSAYDTNLLPVDMAPQRKIGRQLFVLKTRVSGRGHSPQQSIFPRQSTTCERNQPSSLDSSHRTSPRSRYNTAFVSKLLKILESNPVPDLGLHISSYSTERLNKLRGEFWFIGLRCNIPAAFRIITLHLRPASRFRSDDAAFKPAPEGTTCVLHRTIIHSLCCVRGYLDCF